MEMMISSFMWSW